MILEVAIMRIKPDRIAEFEAVFPKAAAEARFHHFPKKAAPHLHKQFVRALSRAGKRWLACQTTGVRAAF